MFRDEKETFAREVTAPLLTWLSENGKPLPWRNSPTPYHVWISEIMLQQTRTAAVIPYYERFLAELPDIPALAAVPDDRLMKLWEGLG
ncbi:MAG TPA: A/G-specific adenine glycosylase, partial [Clostridiales bacterium]|nr:A/G-specific adenine glycosylase [Clostridiales bacterium]